MSLRAATVHSVNTVYARLIDRVGPEAVVETAERMGLLLPSREQPRASARAVPVRGAGTNEVNTLEMASAYGTLASGGLRTSPVPVSRITDARGTVLWEANAGPSGCWTRR